MRLFALILILYAPTASSEFYNGMTFYEMCKSEYSDDNRECLGYISGVDSGINRSGLAGSLYCLTNQSQGQLRLVYMRYAENHPDQLHEGASSIVILSLIAAFPCGDS